LKQRSLVSSGFPQGFWMAFKPGGFVDIENFTGKAFRRNEDVVVSVMLQERMDMMVPPSTTSKNVSMQDHGQGLCTAGYYGGWDGKGLLNDHECKSVCLSEPQCTYAAFYKDRTGRGTCSRYQNSTCSLTTVNEGSNYYTFKKVEVDVVRQRLIEMSRISIMVPVVRLQSGYEASPITKGALAKVAAAGVQGQNFVRCASGKCAGTHSLLCSAQSSIAFSLGTQHYVGRCPSLCAQVCTQVSDESNNSRASADEAAQAPQILLVVFATLVYHLP